MSHDAPGDFYRQTQQQQQQQQQHQQQQQQHHHQQQQLPQTHQTKFQRRDFHLPDRYQWEKRRSQSPNTTPASTVLNSPDLIEVHYQHQQHQVKVGRSPVSQHDSLESSASPNPSTDSASLAAGESSSGGGGGGGFGIGMTGGKQLGYDVIYDDIADNWKSDSYQSIGGPIYGTSNKMNNKMLGKVPIAEYEGSPRRFGDYHMDVGQNVSKLDRPILKETLGLGFVGNKANVNFSQSELCQDSEYENSSNCAYIGQRLANVSIVDYPFQFNNMSDNSRYGTNEIELYLDSNSHSSGELADTEFDHQLHYTHLQHSHHYQQHPHHSHPQHPHQQQRQHHSSSKQSSATRHFTLSPESTDFDSNYGDLDSSFNDGPATIGGGGSTDYGRLYTGMPILEDGLSSGHASDTDNNIQNNNNYGIHIQNAQQQQQNSNDVNSVTDEYLNNDGGMNHQITVDVERMEYPNSISEIDAEITITSPFRQATPTDCMEPLQDIEATIRDIRTTLQRTKTLVGPDHSSSGCDYVDSNRPTSPIWIPRRLSESHDSINSDNLSDKPQTPDEEEADTDLETDRLLGQQRLDDQNYNDEKIGGWRDNPPTKKSANGTYTQLPQTFTSAAVRQGIGTPISSNQQQLPAALSDVAATVPNNGEINNSNILTASPKPIVTVAAAAATTTTTTMAATTVTCTDGSAAATITTTTTTTSSNTVADNIKDSPSQGSIKSKDDIPSEKSRNKEGRWEPTVLIEGVLFRAKYLGSTQLVCEGQPTKSTRMLQAEEAVSRIKALAPEGESQPSTEVDLFISTEKIMVLNTDLKEIMMDHSLRTISYIADIGDLVVLMARRRFVSSSSSAQSQQQDNIGSSGQSASTINVTDPTTTTSTASTITTTTTTTNPTGNLDDILIDRPKPNRTPKMICHVFESDEAQFIAQSIGQAFQVAYMEFLKANGIEDHSFVKEMDYQEVLNSQEIFGDELEIFAKKELQKEVVVPKAKGEILGLVVVESGWGSMLPTVVIANLLSTAAAARCGQLNIGDQIIAINGLSLVGLPLSTCQTYIRNTKTQSAVKFTVVPCPPVVEVKIKRPNTKYQLGFSVQNGVICSLLRGGIAERGGVRVGHRIIEINNQSVVAVPHEKIVSLLATSVGEILMKTMPTSMFRLLTGQENPIYI